MKYILLIEDVDESVIQHLATKEELLINQSVIIHVFEQGDTSVAALIKILKEQVDRGEAQQSIN